MLFLLLSLGCGGNATPPERLGLGACEAWADRVVVGSERIVLCSPTALTLQADGDRADAMIDHYGRSLEAKGYTLERDVSRPSRSVRVYVRDGRRVALAVMGRKAGTTVSLKVVP